MIAEEPIKTEKMNETLYIDYFGLITEKNTNVFMQVISGQISEKNPSEIYLLFSSSGGSVTAGFTMYNYINSLKQSVKFTIHNIGTVDSIANVVFMAGDKRLACSNASFLYHGIVWPLNAGQYSDGQLNELINSNKTSNKKTVDIISSSSELSEAELLNFFVQGDSKDAEFALSKKIIHEIGDPQIPKGSFHLPIILPEMN